MKKYAIPFLMLLILFTAFCLLGSFTKKTASSEESNLMPAISEQVAIFLDGTDGLLRWHTKDITTIDCFVIERSHDGNAFESLGHIRAMGSDRQDYSFRDPQLGNLETSSVTYRLREIKRSGEIALSQPMRLEKEAKKAVQLSATHLSDPDQLVIRYYAENAENTQMNVVDKEGKVVLHQLLESARTEQELNIAVDDWESGTYVIQLFNANSLSHYRITIG